MKTRSSIEHWRDLARILDNLERCVEFAGRLDAYRVRRPGIRAYEVIRRFERRLKTVNEQVDQEIDHVTAEFLMAEHAEKERQSA